MYIVAQTLEMATAPVTRFRMAKRSAEDPRMNRTTEIARALPDAKRQMHGSHAQFLVKKETFAYFLDNHHGDDTFRFRSIRN